LNTKEENLYLGVPYHQIMQTKPLLILLIAIFCLSAQAQTALRYNMKYYGPNAFVTDSKDSADFFRLTFPRESDDNLYLVNDFYKDGKPKMSGKSSVPGPDIRLQGVNVEFFPNGGKKSEMSFKDGKLVGDIISYFPNGKIYLTGRYNDSSRLIVNESRDSAGNVLVTGGNGHWIKYDEAFRVVLSEGNIANGLENGQWQGRLGDTIKYNCTYVNGVVINGVSHSINGKDYIFTKAEEPPMFKGGISAVYRFLSSHVHYPIEAREKNITGKVYMTFVVDKDGSLTDIKVARGIGGGCDEETLRIFKLSPKWKPGQKFGVPVPVQLIMPFSYMLTTENY
jgi:TonB family protein